MRKKLSELNSLGRIYQIKKQPDCAERELISLLHTTEQFTSDYLDFHNDGPDGYGGTVFACHKSLGYLSQQHVKLQCIKYS